MPAILTSPAEADTTPPTTSQAPSANEPRLPLSTSTSAETSAATSSATGSISADDFQALEQKVLRAVEIVRRERDARAAAEAASAAAAQELAAAAAQAEAAKVEIAELHELLDSTQRDSGEELAGAQAQLAQANTQLAHLKDHVASLEDQITQLTAQLDTAQGATQTQIHTLNQERDAVRQRVEKMLEQMDALL